MFTHGALVGRAVTHHCSGHWIKVLRKRKRVGWHLALTLCIRVKIVTNSLPHCHREVGSTVPPLECGPNLWLVDKTHIVTLCGSPKSHPHHRQASRTCLLITCLSKLAISQNNSKMPPLFTFTTNRNGSRNQTLGTLENFRKASGLKKKKKKS